MVLTRLFESWLRNDEGQDLVEYLLLTATVGVCGVVVMNTFDDIIRVVYISWDVATQGIWEPQDPQ